MERVNDMNNVYIGNRYVPVFANPVEWDSLRTYEALTIVTYLGTSYTSKKTVPAGVQLSNTEYWVVTGNYNAQVSMLSGKVDELNNDIGDINDLETTDKSSVVNAINEIHNTAGDISELSNKVGNLNNLNTTNKSSTVGAINEVNNNVGTVDNKIGSLSDLDTANKSSVVNAINEVLSDIVTPDALKINPDDYTGTDAQKLQSAYNDAVLYCNTNNQSAVIILDRVYDITGSTIYLHYPDSAKNAHIKFIGLNHGGIYRGGLDSGYMFAEQSGYVGGCKWHDFINIRFSGQNMTTDARGIVTDANDNYNHSRVFNMLHLNNMSVSYCDFNNLSYIYDYNSSVDGTTSGAYTLFSHHNTYYWCTRIIRLGYSQNAINFENEYMALGMNILVASNNLKSFIGVHFRNCVTEYFNGAGFHFLNSSAVLYDFAVTGCYFEGFAGAIMDFRNPIRTLDISNNTFQLAGNITNLTDGIVFYHDDDVTAILRNNYFARSTAVSSYCLSLNHTPSNGKMIDATGLLMTDQNNNLINGLQPAISQYLVVGESTVYSNSGTQVYSNADTLETLDTTTITNGGLYDISYQVQGNAGGVIAFVYINNNQYMPCSAYYLATSAIFTSKTERLYIPSGATVELKAKTERATTAARDWSFTIKRV